MDTFALILGPAQLGVFLLSQLQPRYRHSHVIRSHRARVIILQTPAYNVYSSREYAPPSLEDLDLAVATQ